MPIIRSIVEGARSVDSRSVFFVIGIAIFYFLFQVLFPFSASGGAPDSCLYSFWAPYLDWWRNPFGLVSAVVLGFGLLSLLLLIDGIRQRSKVRVFTALFAALVIGLWLYGLLGLWNAMRYERGEISREAWYGESTDWDLSWFAEETPCHPST